MSKGYHQIVVIDDGSEIDIANIISHLPVHLIRHEFNLGQGAALQTGFDFARRAGADIVVTFDADNQHNAADIGNLVDVIADGEADVAFGSRFLEHKASGIPLSRRVLLQLARIINFLFSGLLLSDAHNGMRAFSKRALEKLRLTENRMAHASEILFLVKKAKLAFREVPVRIHYPKQRKRTGQTGSDSVRVFIDLVLHKLLK